MSEGPGEPPETDGIPVLTEVVEPRSRPAETSARATLSERELDALQSEIDAIVEHHLRAVLHEVRTLVARRLTGKS